MYLESNVFMQEIRMIAQDVQQHSNGRLRYAEHIALPHYGGNIMLRFTLHQPAFDLYDLDRYEAWLYRLIPAGYLVDFMGNVYQQAGLDLLRLEQTLRRCQTAYGIEPIHDGRYAVQIRADAQALLHSCSLPDNARVWEIQPEEATALILLGSKNEALETRTVDGRTVHIRTAEEVCCDGLIKAAFTAKRQKVSLARVLIEEQNK